MSNLAWIDLETTGLDPDVHDILEIGIIITDRELNEVARESWSISATPYPERVWSREALEMHQASGLVDELVLGTTIEAAAADARRFIDRSGAAGSPMCGASVHFDRAFLRRRAPSLHDVFHYRNFDVSSLRMAAELAGLEVPERKRGLHRALPDLEDSIALARACIERFRGSQLLARRCMVLDERVAYLEDAIKLGGAAYRAARIGLGVPAFDDDYLALKARAEKAERCSLALDDTVAKQGELYRSMKERAEKAEAEASQARNDLAKERVAHEETKYMLDCERHEHDLTKAGQTKYDAELWRARCHDVFQAGELRAKVTRQRRELRRLNRDVALLRAWKAEKPIAKTEEKPAEDRVVRVGDRWSNSFRRCDLDVVEIRSFRPSQWAQEDHWAVGRDGSTMVVDSNGEPRFESWTLVSRKAER